MIPDSFIKQQKIKNSIKALACNFLDFDDRRLTEDSKHIKILFRPNQVSKLDNDPSLTQLSSLQEYLRTIHKRNEIDDVTYRNIRPQSTRPARAHGLPKTHKPFDYLPSFRPIIDTTGTAYQPLAKYLSSLLNPLTHNEFKLKDSFDAVSRILNIPTHLFSQGYRLVSFDVSSLFTNIPLRKTVNIILDRIYKDKRITTSLNKRTLKKLLLDSCTKTPFSLNDQLYRQIDGVSMGSPLGPTLADILMTAFEDEIVRPLLSSNVIKFYSRYVDDTLVLIKPCDIPNVLKKFNSFHPLIKFTHEEFTDNNDVHFLDIKITSTGTTIYRKSTHTGQYIHLSSFTPWCRKTAWLRALVHRAHKICSNIDLLKKELQRIAEFASWNGYPRHMTNKLINAFSPPPLNHDTAPDNNNTENENTNPNPPTIWIHLPFIGKRGSSLIRSCTNKISRLLIARPTFITIYDTTNSNTYLNLKDRTDKELQSSVVYKFSCPGCQLSYIGKTDRCLRTRIKEHSSDKNSEVHRNIMSCEHFQYYQTLLNLPNTLLAQFDPHTTEAIIYQNCVILDKSRHWSLLLYKESLHIHRQKPELNHGTRASKELVIFN